MYELAKALWTNSSLGKLTLSKNTFGATYEGDNSSSIVAAPLGFIGDVFDVVSCTNNYEKRIDMFCLFYVLAVVAPSVKNVHLAFMSTFIAQYQSFKRPVLVNFEQVL